MEAKQTKIVATVGPASLERDTLEQLSTAGVDVFRLNFSHGHSDQHVDAARRIRAIAESTGHNLALLQDLQGPKIRIGRFRDGSVDLEAGQRFSLSLEEVEGGSERVSLSYRDLPKDIDVGQELLLDDGNLRLRVTELSSSEIETEVEIGGRLTDLKGVNVPGAHLVAALSDRQGRSRSRARP